MCTDASTLGFEAVLKQCEERGKNHVIAYASRTLNSPEASDSVTHLETLTVVRVLNSFVISY